MDQPTKNDKIEVAEKSGNYHPPETIIRQHQKLIKRVLILIVGAIVLALVFGIGLMVGFRKADFSFRWGENYHQMFGGPRQGFLGPVPFRMPLPLGEDFINGHGTAGTIMKIDGENIIIKGNDNTEKTILVSDKTIIRRGREDIKVTDLKTGDLIVTIGNPNSNGQIEAQLIRIFNPAGDAQ